MSVIGTKVRVSFRLTFEDVWHVAFEGTVHDIVPTRPVTLLVGVCIVRAPTQAFSTGVVPGETTAVMLDSDTQIMTIHEWSSGMEWIN